ncbi:MAG: hypothetical protein DDT34_02001 [Firmicutes bacterium]|nr:hypothetical protein [Bacillota bacterium]
MSSVISDPLCFHSCLFLEDWCCWLLVFLVRERGRQTRFVFAAAILFW